MKNSKFNTAGFLPFAFLILNFAFGQTPWQFGYPGQAQLNSNGLGDWQSEPLNTLDCRSQYKGQYGYGLYGCQLNPANPNYPPPDLVALLKAADASIRPLDTTGAANSAECGVNSGGCVVAVDAGYSILHDKMCARTDSSGDFTTPPNCESTSWTGFLRPTGAFSQPNVDWYTNTSPAGHLIWIDGAQVGVSCGGWNANNQTTWNNFESGAGTLFNTFGLSTNQVQVVYLQMWYGNEVGSNPSGDFAANVLPSSTSSAILNQTCMSSILRWLPNHYPHLQAIFLGTMSYLWDLAAHIQYVGFPGQSGISSESTKGSIPPYDFEYGLTNQFIVKAWLLQRRSRVPIASTSRSGGTETVALSSPLFSTDSYGDTMYPGNGGHFSAQVQGNSDSASNTCGVMTSLPTTCNGVTATVVDSIHVTFSTGAGSTSGTGGYLSIVQDANSGGLDTVPPVVWADYSWDNTMYCTATSDFTHECGPSDPCTAQRGSFSGCCTQNDTSPHCAASLFPGYTAGAHDNPYNSTGRGQWFQANKLAQYFFGPTTTWTTFLCQTGYKTPGSGCAN